MQISATVHEGEMVKSRVANGKKMDVHEYNKQQKAKQKTEQDYLNFINVPLPAGLAKKILNGEKLAEKEFLNSLKLQSKSDIELTQELLDQIGNAQQLIDNEFADHTLQRTDLREQFDRFKESNAPLGSIPEPETLNQKLERLKQKQVEQLKQKVEPKHDNDHDRDYSPF